MIVETRPGNFKLQARSRCVKSDPNKDINL